jgi:hypothetical protein
VVVVVGWGGCAVGFACKIGLLLFNV